MKKQNKAIEDLINIVEELREKCPWDKKQTIKSLRQLTVEEVFELSDSIIQSDYKNIEEEVGDLLLHVVFYCQIGKEKGKFNLESVINNLIRKLKERHPHIYGGKEVDSVDGVMENWENIKKEKRHNKSTLDNISTGLPALTKSMRIQEKARSVGFDWENKKQVLEKLEEEIEEMKSEVKIKNNKDKIGAEIGDVIFSVINYARFLGIDPEEALEQTNIKFIDRFNWMERKVGKDKKSLKKMTLDEMDKYWDRSKKEYR